MGPGKGTLHLTLDDALRTAVPGGGPAGSFFRSFLLDSAEWLPLDLDVDLYGVQDLSRPSDQGCNMGGGVVSESLVQLLATEGMRLCLSEA